MCVGILFGGNSFFLCSRISYLFVCLFFVDSLYFFNGQKSTSVVQRRKEKEKRTALEKFETVQIVFISLGACIEIRKPEYILTACIVKLSYKKWSALF